MIRRQKKTAVSQDYVESILRSMADMLVILSETGKIQTVNPTTCQLLGYREEELIGKDATLLFSEEEEEEEEVSVFKGLRLQGLIRQGSIRDKGARWKTKTGEKIPVSLSGAALRDEAGNLLGAVIIARDVTERKQAQRIVQEARAYAESIVETVREPLIVLDENLRVKTANRSFYATFDVIPEETVGRLIYELGNRQWNIPALRELLEMILPKQTRFEGFEVSHLFPTIGQKIMLLNARLLQQTTDRLGLVLLAIEDITERKRSEERKIMEETIVAKNRELETILYVTSHDLNEPLRAIENFAEMVNRDYADRLDEEGRDLLRRIVRASGRMGILLKDLATLSRAKRAMFPVEMVEGKVVVQAALARLEETIKQKEAIIRVASDLPHIRCDSTWATEAIYNLVGNALKFTREGIPPEVEIAPFYSERGEVGIAVRDRGPGVAPEHRDRIFDLFQRAVAREVEGTGAGLAIVRVVAEQTGGRVWVQSREGGGAEFIITFGSGWASRKEGVEDVR